MKNDEDKRLQAFQLGWTLCEILGRVRRGARPSFVQETRPPTYAPRVSVSTGELHSSTDQFRDAVLRLEALSRTLNLIGEKDPPDSPLRSPIERLKHALAGESESGKFGPPRLLRWELEEWGLTARAQLLAQDWRMAEAMNTGASLADTFWYMRKIPNPPKKVPGKPRPKQIEARQLEGVPKDRKQEDWRKLLSNLRLKVVRRRLKKLVDVLPPYVAETLIQHLRRWQIGRELAYDDQGVLHRHRQYRRAETPILLPEDENAIQRALGKQFKRWEDMIFGWRPADQFLYWIDRLILILLRFLVVVLLFGLVGAGFGLLTYIYGLIIKGTLGSALNEVLTAGEIGDRLKLLAAASGWLSTIFTVGQTVWKKVIQVYEWIDQNITGWFIAQRTLVTWNRYIDNQ